MEHKLNKNQEDLLKLCFKFRLLTAPLVARHRNKHRFTVKESLHTLTLYGLLGCKFPKEYRLANRPAEYYLTTKGARYLRVVLNQNPGALRRTQYDKRASPEFIDKCLDIYDSYIHLQRLYPEVPILTGSEMYSHDFFPAPHPQLFIQGEQQVFVDIFYEKYSRPIRQRIKQLISHQDSGKWPDDTYPSSMLIVPNDRLKQKTTDFVERLGLDTEFKVYTKQEFINTNL